MSAIDYIKINGTQIYKPPKFTPQREDILRTYETCTGKTIGDRVGWKYADMVLTWDALPQTMVDVLVDISGAALIEFDDLDGNIVEEEIVRASVVALRHRQTVNGVTWWKNVSLSIRFISSHTED